MKECSRCGNGVLVEYGGILGDLPLCQLCRRETGWKPWKEMSLEEKIEDVNERLIKLEKKYGIDFQD